MKAWYWLNWWKNDSELFSYIEEYEKLKNKLKEIWEEVWEKHSTYKELKECVDWMKKSIDSYKKTKEKEYLEKIEFYINRSMNIDWIDDDDFDDY